MSESVLLGQLSEIKQGESKGYRLQGDSRDRLFVVRLSQEHIVAYTNSCPHTGFESASMAWRKDQYLDRDKQNIQCGSHGALFSLATGECIQGPCKGAFLRAEKVTVEQDGSLIWWPNT